MTKKLTNRQKIAKAEAMRLLRKRIFNGIYNLFVVAKGISVTVIAISMASFYRVIGQKSESISMFFYSQLYLAECKSKLIKP